MELPTDTVLVCEQNRTRADLYALWLDDYDVRTALTERQLTDSVTGSVAVAVVNQSFGDRVGSALETVEDNAPYCRIVATRERGTSLAHAGFDHDLTRPVFEEDLVECAETLLHRVNYRIALEQYYRTTAALSAYEMGADESATVDERIERLKERATRFRGFLNELRKDMTSDDVRSVVRDTSVGDIPGLDGTESLSSKYRPDSCVRCDADWTELADGKQPFVKLGAYVWRCADCGHVHLYMDPSHRHVGP